MSENSKIEWTDHTFNPWSGCTKVSPGCLHCYAETLDKRHLREKVDHWGKGAPRLPSTEGNWRQPLRWNEAAGLCKCGSGLQASALHDCSAGRYDVPYFTKQRRAKVFCASLADWLDEEVPIEWLARLLALIHATPNLDWLLLTKRPGNWHDRVRAACDWFIVARPEDKSLDWAWHWLQNFDPANVWIGTTVEDQARAEERIPALLEIPASVRFLSCEPLLGPVDIAAGLPIERHVTGDAGIDWVIAGGESGPGARPMHPQWARALRDQCGGASVPFLFKQWGECVPWEFDETQFNNVIYSQHGRELWNEAAPRDPCNLPKGWDAFWFEQGDITLHQRVGKHAAGRLLDGVEHHAFPA